MKYQSNTYDGMQCDKDHTAYMNDKLYESNKLCETNDINTPSLSL